MSTFREIVYMCMDQLKFLSDDTYYTERHFLYLIDKTRAFLLKQRYNNAKTEVPQSNYQTIDLTMTLVPAMSGVPCALDTDYFKSDKKIPYMLTLASPKVTIDDNFFRGSLTLVTSERMKYVGNNRYLKNIVYASIAPDNYLYAVSSNEEFMNKESFNVNISGVFESVLEGCPDTNEILDEEFPLEEGLIPQLIDMVTKTFRSSAYLPSDEVNNANDDLSNLMSFIRQNMKSDFTKQLE